MSGGRIHAVVVASAIGNVIYERFYDVTSEATRAEVRAAFFNARNFIGRKAVEGQYYVGTYKAASVVFTPVADLVFYAMGTGDYDEMALNEVLDTLIMSLKDVLSRPPTETLLMEQYAVLCLTIDEIILEGIFHNADKDIIRKGTKMKVPWES